MNMNDKYIYKTTMTFGENPNYNVRTTYIDDEGIKRFTDTNQPVESWVRDKKDMRQLEFDFDL